MPRGDRTGPVGMGPKTGRQAGFCSGFNVPGFANPSPRDNLNFGWGRGRGCRGWNFGGARRDFENWFYLNTQPNYSRFGGWASPFQSLDPETEKQNLKNQIMTLESHLELLAKRLEEITTIKETKEELK